MSPILNILVPQVAHTPRVAGRPFFIWICSVLFIDRFCLHFMQYASKPLLLSCSGPSWLLGPAVGDAPPARATIIGSPPQGVNVIGVGFVTVW